MTALSGSMSRRCRTASFAAMPTRSVKPTYGKVLCRQEANSQKRSDSFRVADELDTFTEGRDTHARCRLC